MICHLHKIDQKAHKTQNSILSETVSNEYNLNAYTPWRERAAREMVMRKR